MHCAHHARSAKTVGARDPSCEGSHLGVKLGRFGGDRGGASISGGWLRRVHEDVHRVLAEMEPADAAGWKPITEAVVRIWHHAHIEGEFDPRGPQWN